MSPSRLAIGAMACSLLEGHSPDHPHMAMMRGASLQSLLVEAAAQPYVVVDVDSDESPPSGGAHTMYANVL